MISYRHILLLSLLFITIQNSCSDGTSKRCGEEPGVQTEIVRIKYGTSFGFCVGYCWKQLTINGDEIQFEKMSRDEDEPVNCERDINCSDWAPLSQNFDLENFFALEEVIGCPDCADGGAEWIEIQTNTSKHKVTFEYLSPPATISAQVTSLRELMKSFDACN